ncbi:ERBB receptor feedback inhibitor 1 [Triplophysa tibetana]|uniref:ERBB receptor feedback inhibitor 1 n=1 Tax=Triplophysa tibetana TaxID=1572043 RepID=A0A5A9NBB0_9TELE|nr:ERBB receptor feedback inhibitor 1 [Triplophysa tibetana]
MASSLPYWDQHHDTMDRLCFESMDHSLRMYQQGSTAVGFERRMSGSCSPPCLSPKTSNPTQLLFSSHSHPPAGDQVVPSLQKLSVYEHIPPCSLRRNPKPLPPLPDMDVLSTDEADDSEVEFFSSTSENQCLMPPRYSKSSSFHYGLTGRRSFRGNGQVNFAYYEGIQEQQKVEQTVTEDRDRPHDRPPCRLHRSYSGPARSFKAGNIRHHTPQNHPHEKPEVPPRIPIRPRPEERTGGGEPSVDDDDVDKPPEVPPREPIPQVIPRAISPKCLPIYVNGIMPPTQSFAPYPEYVSKAQPKPSCEGLTAPRTPCILPIIEDGKKVSNTHYFLLPHRPGYLDKLERFFKESDSAHNGYKPKWNSSN